MRLGLFGARADQRGLAYQSQSFAKWLTPDKVFGIDMTSDGLSPYANDWSGYDQSTLNVFRYSVVEERMVRSWLRGLDVVLGAETFYRDEFPIWAREEGVRTILQVNPEFVPWWWKGKDLPKPDVLISPSTWRLSQMPGVIHLPFPVDRELFPFRLRTKADHFVHVAGHTAMADRAGTRMVLAAAPHFKGAKLTIRSQSVLNYSAPAMRFLTLEQTNAPRPQDLYADADIVVLPRRYGGQSLVANEALSSGCPLIVLDRDPDRTWGGAYPVEARGRSQIRSKAGLIGVHEASNGVIAMAMKLFINNPSLVETYSHLANTYADTISWPTLLPQYQELIASLC